MGSPGRTDPFEGWRASCRSQCGSWGTGQGWVGSGGEGWGRVAVRAITSAQRRAPQAGHKRAPGGGEGQGAIKSRRGSSPPGRTVESARHRWGPRGAGVSCRRRCRRRLRPPLGGPPVSCNGQAPTATWQGTLQPGTSAWAPSVGNSTWAIRWLLFPPKRPLPCTGAKTLLDARPPLCGPRLEQSHDSGKCRMSRHLQQSSPRSR